MPELTIIGCGDAFGSGGLLHSCYYISSKSINFLIDCGASSLPGLKKQGVDITGIELIFISHLHGDHFGGLPFLLLDLSLRAHTKPITIISPPGCESKVQQLINLLYPGSTILEKLNIHFRIYKSFESIKIDELEFTAIPVVHSKQSLPHGFRIFLEGKLISFSGDTEWTENLVQIAQGSDLFLCECNFYNSRVFGHLNYNTLIRNLYKLKTNRLLITHVGEELIENKNIVELELATEGNVYQF